MNNRPNFNPNSLDDVTSAITEIIKQNLINNLFTIDIVEVVDYKNEFLSVKPVLQNILTSGEILPITDDDIINNVCMLTLWGDNCEISINATKGDKGLLLSTKGDISKYKAVKKEIEIGSLGRFLRSSGVFIPLDFNTKKNGIMIRNKESSIHIEEEQITITTKNLIINGDVDINGGYVKNDGISIDKGHIHTGDSGGTTSPPIN